MTTEILSSSGSGTYTSDYECTYIDQLCISNRYGIAGSGKSNVLSAKFSNDSSLIAMSFADGCV